MNNKFELIAKVKKQDFEQTKGTHDKVVEYYKSNEWYPANSVNVLCFYLATKVINLPEDYIADVTKYFEIAEPMVDIETYIDQHLCKHLEKRIPVINQIPYSWVEDLEEGDLIFTRYNDKLVVFAAYQQKADLGDTKMRFEEAIKLLEKAY